LSCDLVDNQSASELYKKQFTPKTKKQDNQTTKSPNNKTATFGIPFVLDAYRKKISKKE